MTIRNRFFIIRHRVKRLRTKGARNGGYYRSKGEKVVCKYDWSQPFTFMTQKWEFNNREFAYTRFEREPQKVYFSGTSNLDNWDEPETITNHS